MTSSILRVLQWPANKNTLLNPWYVILWRLAILPFTLAFGLGFYLTLVLSGNGLAEDFRKNWLAIY